jgi:GntR family transcriptional regulator
MASDTLTSGDQLPTIRQLAHHLSINPNTVIRAYKELESKGVLVCQKGTGTFMKSKKTTTQNVERQRHLKQRVSELVARASAEGFRLNEVLDCAEDLRAAFRTKSSGGRPVESTVHTEKAGHH